MTDDQQRARELRDQLAKRAVYFSLETCAEITAALRAAPEGFVLVPVELTEEMIRAALPHHWPYLGEELKEHWRRMLAARPQEASDATTEVAVKDDLVFTAKQEASDA